MTFNISMHFAALLRIHYKGLPGRSGFSGVFARCYSVLAFLTVQLATCVVILRVFYLHTVTVISITFSIYFFISAWFDYDKYLGSPRAQVWEKPGHGESMRSLPTLWTASCEVCRAADEGFVGALLPHAGKHDSHGVGLPRRRVCSRKRRAEPAELHTV